MQSRYIKPIILLCVLVSFVSTNHAQSNFLSTGGYLLANDSNLSNPNGDANEIDLELFGHQFIEKSSSPTMVPVELNLFEVEVISKQEVMVRWSTDLEIENDFFEVEKSIDGEHWYTIANIDGNGTKFETSFYMHIDDKPTVGRSFYRLKQYNYDQETAISSRAFVNIHEDDFQIFPNPTRDKIFLLVGHLSEDMNYRIVDVVGNTVYKGQLADYETEIDVSKLIQGTYLLQVDSTSGYYRKPLVFVKTK